MKSHLVLKYLLSLGFSLLFGSIMSFLNSTRNQKILAFLGLCRRVLQEVYYHPIALILVTLIKTLTVL